MAVIGSERTLEVVCDHETAKQLHDSNFQLQVAKSVIGQNGALIFNTVWKSLHIAPKTSVSWFPVYGFNWTTHIPAPGLQVSEGGSWVQCNIGQVFDIDEEGFFNPSTEQPDASSMKIGKNKFVSDADGGGIHIMVGVQDPDTKDFATIFVDPDGIYPNMSASWQPTEKTQWWYESGEQSSTMVATHDSAIEVGDFTEVDPQSGTYKKESSYSASKGTWQTKGIRCKLLSSRIPLMRHIDIAQSRINGKNHSMVELCVS